MSGAEFLLAQRSRAPASRPTVDVADSRLIIELLRAARPDDAVLSEEEVPSAGRLSARPEWIVDPLDGKREYREIGRLDWAVHVALWDSGRLTAAAVALPARRQVWSTADRPLGEVGPPNSSYCRLPIAAADLRGGSGRGPRRGARAHGICGREDDRDAEPRGGRISARWRPIRVGLRRAGCGGAAPRHARAARQRVTVDLQPAGSVAAGPRHMSTSAGRRSARRDRACCGERRNAERVRLVTVTPD
jgi:Inositol monophosphatase family